MTKAESVTTVFNIFLHFNIHSIMFSNTRYPNFSNRLRSHLLVSTTPRLLWIGCAMNFDDMRYSKFIFMFFFSILVVRPLCVIFQWCVWTNYWLFYITKIVGVVINRSFVVHKIKSSVHIVNEPLNGLCSTV